VGGVADAEHRHNGAVPRHRIEAAGAERAQPVDEFQVEALRRIGKVVILTTEDIFGY